MHRECWNAYDEREIKAWGSQLQMVHDVPLLSCPVCNVQHGNASLSILGYNTGVRANDNIHSARNFTTEWWRRDASELIYQILGYAYQQHSMLETGKEGGLSEERIFITSCKNRCQKTKGDMSAVDKLDAACKAFRQGARLRNRFSRSRGDEARAPVSQDRAQHAEAAAGGADQGHARPSRRSQESEEGWQGGEVSKWMGILKRWLFTAGLEESAFHGVSGLQSQHHTRALASHGPFPSSLGESEGCLMPLGCLPFETKSPPGRVSRYWHVARETPDVHCHVTDSAAPTRDRAFNILQCCSHRRHLALEFIVLPT